MESSALVGEEHQNRGAGVVGRVLTARPRSPRCLHVLWGGKGQSSLAPRSFPGHDMVPATGPIGAVRDGGWDMTVRALDTVFDPYPCGLQKL